MTTTQFAKELGVPYQTVMGWLRDGRIPEAEPDDSNPRGRVWWIPANLVARFSDPETKPQKGRPQKPESALKTERPEPGSKPQAKKKAVRSK